jgi:hypothetical protein
MMAFGPVADPSDLVVRAGFSTRNVLGRCVVEGAIGEAIKREKSVTARAPSGRGRVAVRRRGFANPDDFR